MNCWEILGIAETRDKEAVRKAYLSRLPQFHPEENPEGFRILREAMEEALRLAGQMGEQRQDGQEKVTRTVTMDSGDVRRFLKDAEELYRDYGRRVQPELWRELLACDVCQDLETQKETGWALIGFLMDHIHVPHSCFEVMDQVFGWTEAREELEGHFPEGFIRYLTERIEEEDPFRYDKMPLIDEFDYDSFFELYFELRTAIGKKDREKAEQLLEEARKTGIEHPDLTILQIRHMAMMEGMEQETWNLARQLYETDGEHRLTRYWYVRSALDAQASDADPEKLEKIIVSLVEEDPENPGFWQVCGSFLKEQNRLEQALQAFRRANDCSQGGWDYIQVQIAETADALSRQMEEEGGKDSWELANLCWSARRYDRVRELLTEIQPPEGRELVWLILMAGSCHNLEDYESALFYRKRIWDGYKPEERPLELYMDLAGEYELTGDHEKALEIYGQAARTFTETAEMYYRQAKILEGQGNQNEAARMCSRALDVEFHREAFDLWLEILLDQSQYEEVKERAGQVMAQGYRPAQVLFDYARAVRNLEEYEEARKILDELYERTQGADVVCEELSALLYDMDEPKEALKWVEEALEKRETPRRLYMKADCLHDTGRFQEELDVYERLESQGFGDYYVNYRQGRALERMNLLDQAEASFRAAIEKRPDYGSSWDGLGDILQKQGRWEEAVTAYEAGMELGHLQAARDLCRILKRIHEDDRAIERIKEALKKWPEDGSILILYSDMLVRKKEYEAAVRCLNRYMEVKPSQTGRAYREIAMTYERAKDLDKAEEYYQKSIDQEPKSARAWRLMGKFLANEKKDQERALPYLEKSVELAPDSTYGFMKLGEVYEALGRKDEAVRCYEKALENYEKDMEEDPLNCCNYEGAADVLVHLNRLSEAQDMARKGISLEKGVFSCSCPFCYEGYEDLAKAEEKRGDLEKALEYMELAGRYATTEYYPEQIARLKKAVEEQRNLRDFQGKSC